MSAQAGGTRATLWRRRWVRRTLLSVGAVVAALAVLVGADALLLSHRLTHVAVRLPSSRDGETWVIVGSDSRADVPPGRNVYGDLQRSGARADVVLVVHQTDSGVHVLSVPRDLVVSPQPGVVQRLALTFDNSPQSLVDGLCRTLRIPATHLVVIDMRGLVDLVDDLGGIDVTVPHAVRDRRSGLDLAHGGQLHLGGTAALALVRSRHPEFRIDRRWVRAGHAAGARVRSAWAGRVFESLARQARSGEDDPVTVQRLLWTASGSLQTDSRTSLWDLKDLRSLHGQPTTLPASALANGSFLTPDAGTYQTLKQDGFQQSCAAPAT